MSCATIQNDLIAYAGGDLGAAGRLTVEMHLDACAACREELEDFQQASLAMHSILRHPAPAKKIELFRARLLHAQKMARPRFRRGKPTASDVMKTLVCVAMFILVIGAFTPRLEEGRPTPGVLPGLIHRSLTVADSPLRAIVEDHRRDVVKRLDANPLTDDPIP